MAGNVDKQPLTGPELLSCAKANAVAGIDVAAECSGYGGDTAAFMSQLRQVGTEMGITINRMEDLISDQQKIRHQGGTSVAPDSGGKL